MMPSVKRGWGGAVKDSRSAAMARHLNLIALDKIVIVAGDGSWRALPG